MITTRDARWAQWHLSRLGEGGGASAIVFNLTVIACAVCLTIIASYLYGERARTVPLGRAEVVRTLLYVVAICWIGIGMFPFDGHPIVHNIFGYGEFIVLGVLIAGMRYWSPNLTRRTYWLGYIGVCVAVLMMIGFHVTHFTSLLSIELIGEAFFIGWLLSVTYDSGRMAPKTT